MKKVALFFTLLIVTVALRAYETPIKHLLVGKPHLSLQSFYQIIQEGSSKEKIREILYFLDHHFTAYYPQEHFVAEVIPYNDKSCNQADLSQMKCSSYKDLEFSLSVKPESKLFIINGSEYQYKTKKRVLLQKTTIDFGTALHLIYTSSSKGSYNILLREIEYGASGKKLKQMINLFKVKKGHQNHTCKIAEFDISHDEESYKLITTYAKFFSVYHSCQQHLVSF